MRAPALPPRCAQEPRLKPRDYAPRRLTRAWFEGGTKCVDLSRRRPSQSTPIRPSTHRPPRLYPVPRRRMLAIGTTPPAVVLSWIIKLSFSSARVGECQKRALPCQDQGELQAKRLEARLNGKHSCSHSMDMGSWCRAFCAQHHGCPVHRTTGGLGRGRNALPPAAK